MNLEPDGDYHREEAHKQPALPLWGDGFPGTLRLEARSRSNGKSRPACFPRSPLLSGESSLSLWGDWSLYRQPLHEAAGTLHTPPEALSQGGLIFLPLLSANTLQTLPAPLEGFGSPVFPSEPPREFLFPFCASCPTFSLFVEQKSRLYLQLTPTCFSRTACNDLSLRCYGVLELFPEPLNSILMACGI